MAESDRLDVDPNEGTWLSEWINEEQPPDVVLPEDDPDVDDPDDLY